VADWAQNANATLPLFFSAVDTIHETLIVDAVAKAELVANLVAHDSTATHEEVLFAVRVFDFVPGWVVATEGERSHTLSVAGPPEAERPVGTRVQILHGDELKRVRVFGTVFCHLSQNSI